MAQKVGAAAAAAYAFVSVAAVGLV